MNTDLRFAFRQMLRHPRWTALVVLTLALGIGANTALFSLLHAVVLKPLPFADPDRLMMIWADNPTLQLGIRELPPSQRDVVEWRTQATSFERLAALISRTVDVARDGVLERVGALEVTGNFFATLGVQPVLGRGFTAEEEVPGGGAVVVISDHLWKGAFGGDPNLLGRSIVLNDRSHRVVGIMPPGFDFPRSAEMPAPYDLPVRADLWLPLARDTAYWQDDINRQLLVLGRLKPGVTEAQAQAQMDWLAKRSAQERPDTHAQWSTFLRPLAKQVAGGSRPLVFMLLGAVGFVLLIACANVAGLLLSRAGARQKEMAIRGALGAGRGRVVRQLLTESVLLAVAGGILGLLLGALGLEALLALSPPSLPRLHEATLNAWVLAATLGVSVLAGLSFGLAPAWQVSRASLGATLKAVAGRGGSARRRGHAGLVVVQVAVAFTLMVGALLMVQSFQKLVALDPGFTKVGVHAFDVTFRGARHASGASRVAYFQQIRETLLGAGGIDEVAAVSHLPLGGTVNLSYFVVEGATPARPAEDPLGEHRVVTPEYFRAMGVGLVQGRGFTEFDIPGRPPVAVVNETLARQWFPGGDALGKRLRLRESGDTEWLEIVGVVRDVRGTALETRPTPAFYFVHAQYPTYWEQMTVVVLARSGDGAAPMAARLRTAHRSVDPTLPAANFRTVEGLVTRALARPRFGSWLLGMFAVTAVALTAVGLYGVVSHSVAQRVRELGIRLVLGATPGGVLRMVVAQGLAPVGVGLVVGLGLAWGLGHALASLLFEVQPHDPVTLALAAVTLVGVSWLACWQPARRAARLEPVAALRTE